MVANEMLSRGADPESRRPPRRARSAAWPLLCLIVILALNCLLTPHFASIQVRDGRLYGSLIDILRNGSVVMLLAVGMTVVIATAGIDLSVGSVMALAGTAGALALVRHSGGGVWEAAGSALVIAALSGLLAGLLVVRLKLQPIIATLALLVVDRGIAMVISGGEKVRFESIPFEAVFHGSVLGLPSALVLAALVGAGVWMVLRFTVAGVWVEAVGGNAQAARTCGVPVGSVRTGAYILAGLCAGLAGLTACAEIKEADPAAMGMYLELDAIIAVVIGGTSLTGGRPMLLGSLIGAVLMQSLTITMQMHDVPTEQSLIVKAAVAVVVCVLQAGRLRLVPAPRKPTGATG
jgi:galactofuranose transport system permease protein